MSLACRSEVGSGGRVSTLVIPAWVDVDRVEADEPLVVDIWEILALLPRLVVAAVEAVSSSSLIMSRLENDGRGFEDISTRPNCLIS